MLGVLFRLAAAGWLLLHASPALAQGPSLRLSGPPVADSLPLMALTRRELSDGLGLPVSFTPWHTPDQLRALVSSGQVDAVILTTAMAANLANRGLPTRIVALFSPPVWVVSAPPAPGRAEDLAGQELLMPFGAGEMPALLFAAWSRQTGIHPQARHVGGAMEAVQLLLMGRARHAFLSQPAIALALERGGGRLVKGLDFRRLWSQAFPGAPPLTHSALALVGPRTGQSGLPAALTQAYVRALAWAKESGREAADLARTRLPALAAQMGENAAGLEEVRLVEGPEAATAAWFLLDRLGEMSLACIGGKRPGVALLESVR